MTTQVSNHVETPVCPILSRTVSIEIGEEDRNGDKWLKLSGGWTRIVGMKNLWKLDGEWLNDQPVVKMRFSITTEDHHQLSVFRDLIEGGWYRDVSLSE